MRARDGLFARVEVEYRGGYFFSGLLVAGDAHEPGAIVSATSSLVKNLDAIMETVRVAAHEAQMSTFWSLFRIRKLFCGKRSDGVKDGLLLLFF